MRITKLGHCCLVLEEGGVKLMTDPGAFTVEAQQAITGIRDNPHKSAQIVS